MKNALRILAFVMAAAALFSFSACSSVDENKSEVYVIYSDDKFAPFEYYDDDAEAYIGVDMELLAAIAEDQGFKYEVRNEGFDAAMGAVQAGQADGMIAAMTINEKRKATFDFSDGYFENGSVLVVEEDSEIASLEDLNGKVVAAKQGTTSTIYAESIKEQYGFTISYFESSPTMYQAVMGGSADACFEDFAAIGWTIKNDGASLKIIGDVVNPGYYGFAVKKGQNAELLEMFNAGLKNVKESGKYDEILERYGY